MIVTVAKIMIMDEDVGEMVIVPDLSEYGNVSWGKISETEETMTVEIYE